jgi:hypothetical protein
VSDGRIVLRLTLDEIRALAEQLDLLPVFDPALFPAMRSAYMEIWRVYDENRKDMP